MTARESFASLYEVFLLLDQQINQIENRIKSISEQYSICKQLDEIQGIGELAVTALYASIGDATLFKNGCHLSAYLGLILRHDADKPFDNDRSQFS
ncbi:TPA: transposase [Vibrio parahaemolyticus]